MSVPKFRCEGDLALHNELLEVDEVKAAIRRLDDNPGAGVRRQLLATALRLTPSMSPKLHKMMQESIEQLGCLLYTSPSPRDQRGSRMPSSA